MHVAHTTFTAPAGGAAFGEILIAAAIVLAVLAPVGWFVWRERTGHLTLVGRLADWVATKDGLPRWAGVPTYLTLGSLIAAGFGVWWDVALHMQNGRDEGPLANPSHYPIFLGILGFFSAGLIGMALAKGALPARAIKIIGGWRAPTGSMIITAAGVIALAGFPLDDLWHRLFGQDVTEWGPTHIMMIGGAVTCCLGLPLLHAEARQIGAPGASGFRGRVRGAILLSVCAIPFAFLMEFDLGVPQYPAVTQFIIGGFVITWIFTAVRAYFGPGGALLAWGLYFGVHLFLMATVALLPGVLVARFLLFLPAAVLVELVALVLSPRRGVLFGLVTGFLVGTAGLTAEWYWSKVFMPPPQPLPASALPLMLATGTLAAVGGGLLAAWHVRRLAETAGRGTSPDEITFGEIEKQLTRFKLSPLARPASALFGFSDRRQTGQPVPETRFWRRHAAGLAGIGLFVALMAVFAAPRQNAELSATVTLSEVTQADGRQGGSCDGVTRCLATATVTLHPADAADDAIWLYALAWQGRHHPEADMPSDPGSGAPGVMRIRMLPTGTPGQFRTEHQVPLYGHWKTLIRLHQAPATLMALPLFAPDDPAITAAKGRQILVRTGSTLPLITESSFLQRESKDDVPAWLWATAFAIVGLSWAALLAYYGWCYAQAANGTNPVRSPRRAPVPARPAKSTLA